MKIEQHLESTYLKTPEQAGISAEETWQIIKNLTQEAIAHDFYGVVVRAEHVKEVKKIIHSHHSNVQVITVIDFPNGNSTLKQKRQEAKNALDAGADELDFVINYTAFKENQIDLVENEVKECTAMVLSKRKIAKWIIEVAALNAEQIAQITQLIHRVVATNFSNQTHLVYVKSSTGFYKSANNEPNGATPEAMRIMKENCGQLPLKGAGGIRNIQDALQYLQMGVTKIGTSAAKAIADGKETHDNY